MTFHIGKQKGVVMTRDEDALRMLAEVEAANTDMAERAKAPIWYHPALGLLMGGLCAVQARRRRSCSAIMRCLSSA